MNLGGKIDFYNSWIRDDLETLKRDVEIALVIYDIRINLLPTAVENIIEKAQALTQYVIKDDIQVCYIEPTYSDSYST